VITDGLPELMDEERRELGYHSVASLVAEAIQHSHSAQQIVEYILRKAKDWNKQALPNDDVTIVCLRYTE
jgi:serine phosphatase RsbU (regulator of sigma subunit)